jgi:hypothetical protein
MKVLFLVKNIECVEISEEELAEKAKLSDRTRTEKKQAKMLPLMILGTMPIFSGMAYRQKRCSGHLRS